MASWMQWASILETQHQVELTVEKLQYSLRFAGSNASEKVLIAFRWSSGSISLREVINWVKDLIVRLLNDPVTDNTKWPNHNKKVKQETNLQSANRSTCPKWHPSCYWYRTPKDLISMALFWLPYLWWLYLRWPYLWESGQMFQLTKPIRPTKAIKQMRDRPIYIGVRKKWA